MQRAPFARDLDPRIHLRRFAGAAHHAERLARPIRVAHLTDLHVGRVTPMWVQEEMVRRVNRAAPDLIAITGDFVAHSLAFLDGLEAIVGAFEAPVVAVLGNHDHWCGPDEVRRALRRAGAEVLDNAHTVVTVGGERLQIVGLDDAYTGHADLDRAVRGLDGRLATLGLSHIAEEADALWARRVPLVLSGHTHGGQITVARLHEVALGRLVGHRYVHGIYGDREGDGPGAVYVGAGIGAAVMPLRVGDRGQREIAIFELGATPGTFPEPLDAGAPHPGRSPGLRTLTRRRRKVERLARRRARRLGDRTADEEA